ncbi:MAG TPA: glycosyltransferase family 2 protein [Blastocatellia bacterium]|nr:glycosyltransferase family 2 protein [Blastocatellia bacterium]
MPSEATPRADNKAHAPVIILNWNGWEDTFHCLRSLSLDPEVGEVWLVDNGSRDDRSSEAFALCPGLRVLRLDNNYGYAGGYNRALKLASKEGVEFAYLLNNDSTVVPGFLSALVRIASANGRIAAAGSLVLYAEPSNFVQFDGTYHGPGARPLYEDSGVRIAHMVAGSGMLVRLRAMEECGYFDERFFCYCEEAEWCFRVRDHGLLCVYCADSAIIHKGQSSDLNSNAMYYRFRNPFLLFERLSKETRKAEARKLKYEAAVVAEVARRSGRLQEWISIAHGLHDGLVGKTGPRPSRSVSLIPALRLALLSLKAHLHDKWQSLWGNQPGYGKPLRVWDPGW